MLILKGYYFGYIRLNKKVFLSKDTFYFFICVWLPENLDYIFGLHFWHIFFVLDSTGLEFHYLKWGPHTRGMSILWELTRNAELQACPRPAEIESSF